MPITIYYAHQCTLKTSIFISSALVVPNVVYEWLSQVKCWQIRRQTKAPQAAGAIHTDFERGFICAEVFYFLTQTLLELCIIFNFDKKN